MSSKQAITKRQKLEARERAILDAARDVFVAHSYDGARMAEIARRAGIAEGTVYLYYKTKNDLMAALVADFWDVMTAGAADAITEQKDCWGQLRELADFHLTQMLARFDFIELTQQLRSTHPDDATRQQMRGYVAVFDQIFERGKDKGDIKSDAVLWIARDCFYGTLEYSARTIVMRDAARPTGVADNLVWMFRQSYSSDLRRSEEAVTTCLTERLEQAVIGLEGLLAKSD